MDMAAILRENAERYGSRTAFVSGETTVTFKELGIRSLRLANALAAVGVRKGDKVAIMMLNGIEYAMCYLAIFQLRAVAVPLDMGIKDELLSYLGHSEAKVLISEKMDESARKSLLQGVPTLNHIISRGDELSDLLSSGNADPVEPPCSDSDPCVIFYTSGTTGRPKGVLWNYRHLDAVGMIAEHRKLFTLADVMICAIPMSHCAGMAYVLCPLYFGLKVVMMDRFVPPLFLSLLDRHSVTCFFAVPAVLEALMALKQTEAMTIPSVRWIAVFGAMSSPLLAGRLQKLFEKTIIFGGYGLTETAPPTTLPPLDKVKRGSVGQAPPWVEMRIVDDNDQQVRAGETGEVVFKSWVVMVEYYRDPEMTGTVMKNGWFHTGDFGKVDEEGYLFLVGRKKEMIIVGGLNVYPEEVEAVILQHPDVREAAVIGVADELRGEKLKAVVALKEGRLAKREDIVSFCQKRLPPFKTPRIVEFLDALPKLPSGKIARRQLS